MSYLVDKHATLQQVPVYGIPAMRSAFKAVLMDSVPRRDVLVANPLRKLQLGSRHQGKHESSTGDYTIARGRGGSCEHDFAAYSTIDGAQHIQHVMMFLK